MENGGNGGGCGHQSTLPIGPADGKHARGSFWSAHARGLKRFGSGQGSGAQAYGYIPRLADAAMDKIGQNPQERRKGFNLPYARPYRWNRHVPRPREADFFANSAPPS